MKSRENLRRLMMVSAVILATSSIPLYADTTFEQGSGVFKGLLSTMANPNAYPKPVRYFFKDGVLRVELTEIAGPLKFNYLVHIFDARNKTETVIFTRKKIYAIRPWIAGDNELTSILFHRLARSEGTNIADLGKSQEYGTSYTARQTISGSGLPGCAGPVERWLVREPVAVKDIRQFQQLAGLNTGPEQESDLFFVARLKAKCDESSANASYRKRIVFSAATNLTINELDPSLFSKPAGFVEVPFDELKRHPKESQIK